MATVPGQGLALEPIGGQNSLDQFIRSIEGLTGTQGQKLLSTGASTTAAGTTAMAPALDFLTKLTKGDQADITQATQPEIDQITQQFDQIRNMISMQPRGGGKTSALAEAPFKKAGEIQRIQRAMRTGAAGELGGLATDIAGIGLSQAGLGTSLEDRAAQIALQKQGLDYSQPSALEQIIAGVNAFL